MAKIRRTPEEYKQEIFENGFIALEQAAKMRDDVLVECRKCGFIKRKRVQSIVNRKLGCSKCAGNERLTTEEFAYIVKRDTPGYALVSEVLGAFKKATLICDVGHKYAVNPADFIHKGYRCPTCKFIKMSGEGHWNYNADLTQEERNTTRAFPGYTRWQYEVKERDKFTCQCCRDKRGGNLVSHHLESWDISKEKRLDINNGVTLCEDCHKDFHGRYGYGKNTTDQYNEWMASPENGRRFIYAEKEVI